MVDSSSFFLTYPQSDFENQELINAIISVLSGVDNELVWARACREQHDDGSPHSHIVFKCKKRVQRAGVDAVRMWDVNGRHPNAQSVRSINKCLAYVAKDGEYTDHGTVPGQVSKRPWSDIVQAAGGEELQWLQVVHEERMGPHVCKRLRELSSSKWFDLDEYDGRPIRECMSVVPTTITSMCIVGAPGIGKTGWAMLHMPRPCLLVKNSDSLRKFRPGYHQSILFDDCDFKHKPRSEQMQLCDYENQCQPWARYDNAVIPARVPRLFLCNIGQEPFIHDVAIQGRRLTCYYV